MAYTKEQKIEAHKMFLQGDKVSQIEDKLDIPRRTLYNWIDAENWGEMLCNMSTLYRAHRRMQTLLDRENKTQGEMEEMAFTGKLIERLEKVELNRKRATGELNVEGQRSKVKGQKGNSQRNTKGTRAAKNDFSDIDIAELEKMLKKNLFEYQLELWDRRRERNRQILKSRQIGATFYFSKEAFFDALMTGRNKIFLSASRAQSDVFREYIKQFALEYFEVELKGKDKIEITTPNGVCTFYFLSTNSQTAQTYHGDVYVDEYFWIPKFNLLKKVASAMGSQKQWTKTYFSTPSTKSHEAFPFWSGDDYQEKRKNNGQEYADWPTITDMQKGIKCPDGTFRMYIDLVTAEQGGCDLFDIEQLKEEYTEEEFLQLFMCKFIDDTASVFKFNELEKCLADLADWKDFAANRLRPFNGKVWIGVDPAKEQDGAAIVVVAPPARNGGKFRVLERHVLKNALDKEIAEFVQKLTRKYTVDEIVIDRTGQGKGAHERIMEFYPRAKGIWYDNEMKGDLVRKAQQVIRAGRVLWDSSYSDIAHGFLQITKVVTGGGHITYKSPRNRKTGHADSAWALMQVLLLEGYISEDGINGRKKASVTVA